MGRKGHGCLHHPRQSGLRGPLGHRALKLLAVPIALAAPPRRVPQRDQVVCQARQGPCTPPPQARLVGRGAHHQHALAPRVGLLRHRMPPALLAFPLVNHHLCEDFARLGVDFLQTLPRRRTRQRLLAPGGELVSGRGWPIGTQVTAPTCYDVASCAQGPHFTIADHQDRRRPQRRDRRLIGGDIQPIIGAVAGHGLAHQRQAQRIERRQHGFALAQVGAMVCAVTLVEKALVGCDVVIHTDTGTVQAQGLGGQALDTYPFPQHRPLQGGLGRRIAQHRQDIAQTIVGAIGVTQGQSQQGVEGLGAFRHPVAHRYEALLTLGQDVAEPDADQGADTGTLPGPLGCDMGVNHVADAHLLDDTKEEGHTVDLFIRERKSGVGRFHIG